MSENNFYPVFVADQVLTADHLNEIVNYLDEQDRLTRNKLIGIGIVCGLDLKVSSTQIEISKGCGVTSEGYLVVQGKKTLKHYRNYTLPEDFYPGYKSVYEKWNMWELLTEEDSAKFDDADLLTDPVDFLKNKIVVLLLEMKETVLKNCLDSSCDDKGEKIEFAVKPLLVSRSDIDTFIKNNVVGKNGSTSESTVIKEISLKRFDVPLSTLSTSDSVFNAFLKLVDDNTLKTLSEVLKGCYTNYKTILYDEPVNPFENVFKTLKDQRDNIKSKNPYFIQYFYDLIDDIIKAYYEFKDRVFYVQSTCCPAENLFPLHLMLGEATKNTPINTKSKYRQYFIYSNLFNQQKDLQQEVQILFKRLKAMVQNYIVKDPTEFARSPVKITPSKYLDKPLSERCIPYYYNPLGLYEYWSWNKTSKGNSRYNLSYNASSYSSSDVVINPLLYDIERFSFFRIEGHIGKEFSSALSNILSQRLNANLPFDVIALSTAAISKYSSTSNYDCNFKDLESLFTVIKSELVCKSADAACFASGIEYDRKRTVFLPKAEMNEEIKDTVIKLVSEDVTNKNIELLTGIIRGKTESSNYQKGDFIRNNCKISNDTIGKYYLNVIDDGDSFTKPDSDNIGSTNNLYSHLFYFLDCVENLMEAVLPLTLDDFNIRTFKARYNLLMAEMKIFILNESSLTNLIEKVSFTSFINHLNALLYSCIDDQLEALKNEYLAREKETAELKNLMNYIQKHPGLEHKSGVPKGGTFILVYQETQRKSFTYELKKDVSSLSKEISNLRFGNTPKKSSIISEDFLKSAEIKDPELTEQFYSALSKYMETCEDMDEETEIEIKELLFKRTEKVVTEKFKVTEFTVIADFYLPYLCCSDCAPVAYIMPKERADVLKISISETDFCNDDDKTYPVTVSPAGGVLTSSCGGLTAGKNEFSPYGLSAGVCKLTYTLSDLRIASVDVTIYEPLEINFEYLTENDGLTVTFSSTAGTTYSNYEWDFGDGSEVSTETKPIHTYSFEESEKTFNVSLTVNNGPCSSKITQAVRLVKPVEFEFSIEKTQFCSNDTTYYEFDIRPDISDISEITNPNGLIIEKDSTTGKYKFSPSIQSLTKSKEYKLKCHDIRITISMTYVNADFWMEIFRRDSLKLSSKNKAESYVWTIIQEGSTIELTGKTAMTTIGSLDNAPMNISLKAANKDCTDIKTFIFTIQIFEKHQTGKFDNHTTG